MTPEKKTEKTEKTEEPKKAKTLAKYAGGSYLPGVPARDLTEEDFEGMDEATLELLRADAEREKPLYKHTEDLGHSKAWKAEREREKAEKADNKADAGKKD